MNMFEYMHSVHSFLTIPLRTSDTRILLSSDANKVYLELKLVLNGVDYDKISKTKFVETQRKIAQVIEVLSLSKVSSLSLSYARTEIISEEINLLDILHKIVLDILDFYLIAATNNESITWDHVRKTLITSILGTAATLIKVMSYSNRDILSKELKAQTLRILDSLLYKLSDILNRKESVSFLFRGAVYSQLEVVAKQYSAGFSKDAAFLNFVAYLENMNQVVSDLSDSVVINSLSPMNSHAHILESSGFLSFNKNMLSPLMTTYTLDSQNFVVCSGGEVVEILTAKEFYDLNNNATCDDLYSATPDPSVYKLEEIFTKLNFLYLFYTFNKKGYISDTLYKKMLESQILKCIKDHDLAINQYKMLSSRIKELLSYSLEF